MCETLWISLVRRLELSSVPHPRRIASRRQATAIMVDKTAWARRVDTVGELPDRRVVAVRIGVAWLGHSTVVLDIDGVRVIADPLLRVNNGILRRRGKTPRRRRGSARTQSCCLHLHHDHAELASLRRLGDVPILTADANAAWLRRRGLNGIAIDEDTWADVGSDHVIRVRAVPAIHRARPMPHRPNAATGHLVVAPSGSVWVAGDTELFRGSRTCRPQPAVRRPRHRPRRRLGSSPLEGAYGA